MKIAKSSSSINLIVMTALSIFLEQTENSKNKTSNSGEFKGSQIVVAFGDKSGSIFL